MYLNFFGFSKEPFHTTPDPEFLYLSPSHKQALGSIIYGISKRKGFIAIVGEVGVGKTTILRAYLEKTAQQNERTVYIFNSNISFTELVKTILRSLDLQPAGEAVSEMTDQLHEALIAEYRSGGTVVLVIDEAQNMPIDTLENLRMLSNLETSTDKLIQMILIGQPELETMLNRQDLRQLRQRLAIWAKIDSLTVEESRAYIECRLAQVTAKEAEVFTSGAIKLLINAAAGIPRRLNILCDNALVTGFGYQTKPVSSKIVREIISDMGGPRPHAFWKWIPSMALALIIVIGLPWVDRLPWPESMRVLWVDTMKDWGMGNITKTGLDRVASDKTIPQSIMGTRNSLSKETVPLRTSQVWGKVEQKETGHLNNMADKAMNGPSSTANAMVNVSADSPVEGVSPKTEVPRSVHGRDSEFPVVKIVKEGDTLSQLTKEVYGEVTSQYMEWVKQHNPQIVMEDKILSGGKIVFPLKVSGSGG